LIDGARQVGKTYSVREYGRRHFESVVEINFIKDIKAKNLFRDVNNEADVLVRLSALPGVKLVPHKTLIFLDNA